MAVRRVLVTGGNRGIGLAIVQELLKRYEDTYVLLGSRSLSAAEQAIAAMPAEHRARCTPLQLDVASEASIRDAAALVKEKFAPLHGLVNNAGVMPSDFDLKSGLDINVRGTVLMCKYFEPMLLERIVNMSSGSAPNFVQKCAPEKQAMLVRPESWAQVESAIQEMENIYALDHSKVPAAFEKAGFGSFAGISVYGFSKACVSAFTYTYAKEVPRLITNACSPGFIETDMTQHFVSPGQSAKEAGLKTPAEGAEVPIMLLMEPIKTTGKYYGSDGKRSPWDKYRSPGAPEYTGE
ncbi:Carbonyl reductase NADPH 1 [Porphyridium purpureum]|uniref:Carbonyl reductase NADPH 1 n=1 Tax=Porphyridium purpureum TaxID=35688 RepID=A0A5J4YKC0_PORPP|nr:Carbonyl reductase NADPH 1 [Porphyridium purpureum]|eukprot:POR6042..scf291_13